MKADLFVLTHALNEVSSAWAPLMVRSCWQGGLALAAAWTVCRFVRRISPPVQCWLWRLAFLKVLAVFIWVAPIKLPLLPASDGGPSPEVAENNPVNHNNDPYRPVWSGITESDQTSAVPVAAPEPHPGLSASGWLFLAWLIGVGFCLWRLLREWIRVRRLVARLSPVVDEELIAIADECCRRLRLRRQPELLASHDAGMPFLVGSICPAIVLTDAVLNRCTPDGRQAAIAHELAHVKRHDLLWNWLPTLAQALLFFHPLVWLARREWRLSQEIATDELAVAGAPLTVQEYARSLVELATTCPVAQRRAGLTLALSETYAQLSRRLIAMKSFCPKSRGRRWTMSLLLAMIAVCGLVPWRVTADEADQASNGVDAHSPRTVAVSGATGSGETRTQQTATEETQPATTAAPDVRTMQVYVLGEDRQPLAGARVHSSITTKEAVWANRNYVADEEGQVVISLPQEPNIVRLWARRDGYAPMFADWWMEFDKNKTPVPDEFTFELHPGTIIGGFVRGEDGAPIEGATVEVQADVVSDAAGGPEWQRLIGQPKPDRWLAAGDDAVTTDARGRWTLSNVPAGNDFTLLLKLTHPEYVSDYGWHAGPGFLTDGLERQQSVPLDALRNRSATFVMQSGIRVTGTVTDPEGNPVPQAVVVWGDDPYDMEGSQEVLTNDRGVYRLPPLPAGPTNVTVVARGWAPTRREIQITADNRPVDFQLQPGRTVRMRFVDEAGEPVPGVSVRIDQWRGSQSLYSHRHSNVQDMHVPIRADRQGIYEWTWAPEDEVTYYIGKRGFGSTSRRLGPGEYVITMSKSS